jgi:hypothetical protein
MLVEAIARSAGSARKQLNLDLSLYYAVGVSGWKKTTQNQKTYVEYM